MRKRQDFGDESLLDEFSISENSGTEGRETGCVLPETGSNPQIRGYAAADDICFSACMRRRPLVLTAITSFSASAPV
jgi:hypothetical protein